MAADLMAAENAEWVLARRPQPHLAIDCFEMRACAVPTLTDSTGDVLLRSLHFSVDPYMRVRRDAGPLAARARPCSHLVPTAPQGKCNDDPTYFSAPWAIGDAPDGRVLAEVVESRAASLAAGDVVKLYAPWRRIVTASASNCERIDTSLGVSMVTHLGILGGPGEPPRVYIHPRSSAHRAVRPPTRARAGLSAYCSIANIAKPKPGDV